MLDTINMDIKREFLDIKKLNEIFTKLTFKVDSTYSRGNSSTYFNDKIHFTLTSTKLRISLSLAKYYQGNNLNTLTYMENLTAIDSLCNHFDLPFQHAIIRRVDLAHNFNMELPVRHYLNMLVKPCSKINEIIYPNESRYFQTHCETLCFYDKKEELSKKDKNLFKSYKHEHILRYEMRIKPKVKFLKAVNLSVLTIKDLFNKNVFNALLSEWLSGYLDILKIKLPIISHQNISTVKKIKEYSMIHWINHIGGIEKLVTEINLAKLSPKAKFDLKLCLSRLGKTVKTEETDLEKELDSKILSFFDNYMAA
jgi:hypothetical protein